MGREVRVVRPDTRRIVEGLRDTGYTFVAAVADIVDNSIAAEAKHVSIWVGTTSDGLPVVTISDDGYGMDTSGLENAMRYGSRERDTRNSLGRFGLGLKTASTGFCRRLTVVSTISNSSSLKAAAWDLDDLATADEWNLAIGDATDDEADMFAAGVSELEQLGATPDSGTLVWWSKIDKLLKTKSGAEAKNKDLAMRKAVSSLREHLEMVFQRFLDQRDDRARTVIMGLNGVRLAPWDPFCEETGGDLVIDQDIEVDSPSGEFDIKLRAFILPRKEEFESIDDWNAAKISIDRQGIYLYREERLIEGPDWLGTGSTETHINNLRVELSFPAQLDEVFGVGIKKSGVHLDSSLTDILRKLLAPVRREADNRSRKGNARKTAGTSANPLKRPTELTISRLKRDLTLPEVQEQQDGSITMRNNSGEVALVDNQGRVSNLIKISNDAGAQGMSVARATNLEDGLLWEARLNANAIQVVMNAGHDWYRKAYVPNIANSPLVQSIEYLFYALAQAEMNNTNTEFDDVFEEFKFEVSRNLRRLVKDLPEPADED